MEKRPNNPSPEPKEKGDKQPMRGISRRHSSTAPSLYGLATGVTFAIGYGIYELITHTN
jgi:hypothetical protein